MTDNVFGGVNMDRLADLIDMDDDILAEHISDQLRDIAIVVAYRGNHEPSSAFEALARINRKGLLVMDLVWPILQRRIADQLEQRAHGGHV